MHWMRQTLTLRGAAFLVAYALLSSCASSGRHEVRMPKSSSAAEIGAETGQVDLVFSREASNVVVAINGTLVVEAENAKRIQIMGVETGYANLSIAADGVERSARVWIDSDTVTAVPIGNPGSTERMNPVVTAALSIVAFLISRTATDFLF